eukprot:TRINITY_DN4549_c0_g4_i1.p1 TRINITY_DN4549_c0_g4~~TRINITY_DN4549_c0_g4_i1.p1  ORF type:complete len:758 (+),score=172.89 TRINITY_DN4549_c0_g4_i1:30-2276(+)
MTAAEEPIYLDYNATTPIVKEVADHMAPFLYGTFGNPSSSHTFGRSAKRAVEESRAAVADMLHCKPSEITFTSGGTESNNFAIKGVALANRQRGNHIITSAVEHPAVLEVCHWLEQQGFRLTVLDVDEYGRVNPQDLRNAITDTTVLVTIMHANNEVGTVQPIKELSEIAHAHGALFHTDAAQSVGKIPVHVEQLGVDLLSVAGHKLYAPKGVGALYIRSGVQLAKFMHGADHEHKRRAGTENVLALAGLGKAASIVSRDLSTIAEHMKTCKDAFQQELEQLLEPGSLKINGHPNQCLPNTLSVSFRSVEANTLLSEIGEQVAASPGAACHSETVTISSVLKAMKVPVEWAMGTVRFSVGRLSTVEEVKRAAMIVAQAVRRLQPRIAKALVAASDDDAIDVRSFKLTHYTRGLGCACKLRPQQLERVLASLPVPKEKDPRVLVGLETSDDAAVYKVSDEVAIVSTVDFFTPVCDDAYWFGAISAANSMSDVWAMGGVPAFALNIVGFPSNRLPTKVLQEILRGASDKTREAGVSILGGHTVDDTEPKFGLAVTGFVHPAKILRNCTAKPGNVLIVTKPLGFGIYATAAKQGLLDEPDTQELYCWMATLNGPAAAAISEVGATACTDVTGFGLLGHLGEMLQSSHVSASLVAANVPRLKRALSLVTAGAVPGGTLDNLAHFGRNVAFNAGVAEEERLLLADAQTSGGLLIVVEADRKDAMLEALRRKGVESATAIGTVTAGSGGHINVL